MYYGGGCTCSLFIRKQTLVQYKEEKKKEKKNARASRCICISSPVPHRRCGCVIRQWPMQSIYPLIKISSILKIKTYLELKTQMHLELLPSLGCDTGASHTMVLWLQVTQVRVQFQKSDRLGHRYAHTSYEVFVPWTLYQALMRALPQVAEVFCVHILHTSYLSLT